MFKLYRKSQEVQRQWIRNHPVQFIALNAITVIGYFGYAEYQDRKCAREIAETITNQV